METYDQEIKDLTTEISEIEKELAQPEIMKDISKLKEYSKKLTTKKERLLLFNQLKEIENNYTQAENMAKDETDQQLITLAQEEMNQLQQQKAALEHKLITISSEQSQQIDSCILEVRPGTGGEEANLFAGDLFRMYSRFAESKRWKVTILHKAVTDTGGIKELIAQIDGGNCFHFLQYENGVHRVQRVPSTESAGRIHTSAASVVTYPLIETDAIEIDPAEITIDVYRSSGPGGQSVNTTDSAVRITHKPTGIVVTCQDEKSQHKNKKKAMSILQSRLMDLKHQQEEEALSDLRKSAIQSGDRSAKIRTYNFPQSRITDHRVKKSWFNMKAILDGDFEEIAQTLHGSLQIKND